MNIQYDYHKRENTNSWLLKHIKVLIDEAVKYKNASFILYAAFEARNLLEKTEFDLIIMSQDETERKNLIDIAKGRNGLRKTNAKYKTLKYKFQTFNEALCKVVIDDVRVKIFDYKKSNLLQTKLGEYMHVYTLNQNDFNFENIFIQKGIETIKETLNFINSYYTKTEKGYLYGIINFNTLHGSIKKAFNDWKNSASQNTDELYKKLENISKKEFNGQKLSILKK